jgi:hypothetical protein
MGNDKNSNNGGDHHRQQARLLGPLPCLLDMVLREAQEKPRPAAGAWHAPGNAV